MILSTTDLTAVMPSELCNESAIWPLDLLLYSGQMVCTMCLDNYTRVSVSLPQITHFSAFLVYIVSSPHEFCIYPGRVSGEPYLYSPQLSSLLHNDSPSFSDSCCCQASFHRTQTRRLSLAGPCPVRILSQTMRRVYY